VFELDCADLVVIAGRVLGVGPGVALDQVDLAAARAALAAAKPPEAELIEAELTETGPAELGRAAVLLIRELLRHRPFPDQNERVAVAAALQFLALNGWRADLDPPEATVVVIEGLAAGEVTPADAAAWLRFVPRSSPSPAIPVQAVPRTTGATGRARVMTRSVGCEPRSPGFLTCSASTVSSPTTAAGRARSRAYEAARCPASSATNRSGWSRCGPWPASSITTSR
jgi:hypothetical protein